MNKKAATIFSVLIIVVFIAYMIFDTARPVRTEQQETARIRYDSLPDMWRPAEKLAVGEGTLKAIAVSSTGRIYAAGESFVNCYSADLKKLWSMKPPESVTAVACPGDTVFASSAGMIMVIGNDGRMITEWGPYEDKSYITSVTANHSHVAYADAGNRMVVILGMSGVVERIIGQNDSQFIVPSPYFDVALDGADNLYIANTGHRRIETRTIEGKIIASFGEPGMAAGAFCGCCNPAHFALLPSGFVTAEKGINRIKILSNGGKFVEFVSSDNRFLPSIPLDIASADGKRIYAANPADSHIYVFTRTD